MPYIPAQIQLPCGHTPDTRPHVSLTTTGTAACLKSTSSHTQSARAVAGAASPYASCIAPCAAATLTCACAQACNISIVRETTCANAQHNYETRPAPQTSEHYVNIAALLYITIAKRGWPCAIVFLDTACRVRVPILALNIRPRHFISLP